MFVAALPETLMLVAPRMVAAPVIDVFSKLAVPAVTVNALPPPAALESVKVGVPAALPEKLSPAVLVVSVPPIVPLFEMLKFEFVWTVAGLEKLFTINIPAPLLHAGFAPTPPEIRIEPVATSATEPSCVALFPTTKAPVVKLVWPVPPLPTGRVPATSAVARSTAFVVEPDPTN